ncbi:MAG: hypothetical protein ACFFD4_34495 [Candidatus Odinarchaeota archaeon]
MSKRPERSFFKECLVSLGFTYPEKMAPLEHQYRKYDRLGRRLITASIITPSLFYSFLSVFMYFTRVLWSLPTFSLPIFTLPALFLTYIFGAYLIFGSWWAIPLAMSYFFHFRGKKVETAIMHLVYGLIIDSNVRSYQEIENQTGIPPDKYEKAVQALITSGKLDEEVTKSISFPSRVATDEISLREYIRAVIVFSILAILVAVVIVIDIFCFSSCDEPVCTGCFPEYFLLALWFYCFIVLGIIIIAKGYYLALKQSTKQLVDEF